MTALFAAVVALVLPHGHSHKTLVERIPCDQHHPRNCVEAAVRRYHLGGWQRAWMFWIPGCESTWHWWAYNGVLGAAGPYQFIASTWATTPYRRHSRYSWRWSSLAAGWMVTVGRSSEWACR